MTRQELSRSAEQPLQGVMLCFTSIGPEDRSRYAEIAKQMGADHKLDLTSDTTHLIVGNTESLKYQYVAREREDITVVQPEWIKAARDVWVDDLPLDLNALTQRYRVPTLAGLKICITGFDDLSFRAQLQKNVTDNGGLYTGDLTKDVTHLIAAKPEGKKYEYGMQWQTKVVSLKWYKETLERGMQLDESLYHPTVSVAEQGVGAWIRKARSSPQLGKRSREENAGPEPPRKLRRTASARLGSQSQDMWSDIVGGAGFDAQDDNRPPLKPSVSMPALRRPNHRADEAPKVQTNLALNESHTARSDGRILAGYHFMVQCLDQKKNEYLGKVLKGLGAILMSEDDSPTTADPARRFVMMAHDVAQAGPVPEGVIPDGFQVVSELWLEKCMIAKSFIAPKSYPLGQVIRAPRALLKGSTINVSGFDIIENVHIVKIVALLGGTYANALSSAVSMLICRDAFGRKEKLELAQHLGIAVVSEDWLWSTMRSQSKASIKDYLLQPLRAHGANVETSLQSKAPRKQHPEVGTSSLKRRIGDRPTHRQGETVETPATTVAERPSTSVLVQHEPPEVANGPEIQQSSEHARGSAGSETQAESHVQRMRPLREVSPTSARRNGRPVEPAKAAPRSLDGTSSMGQPDSKENTTAGTEHAGKTINIEAINGAIRDILDARSKKKAVSSRATDEPKKKSRLVGRALSNLSNSSSRSNVRHSRASSIDSINTDGRGSEVPAIPSGEGQSCESTAAARRSSFSFTGRAKITLGGLSSAALGMDDPDVARAACFQAEQEAAPRMTQLGYEDSEEAILLREKLAASRKKRSRKEGVQEQGGSHDDDPKPPATKRKPADRKIRDDDILARADAGWGAGRRTRHKQRSPQGMTEF